MLDPAKGNRHWRTSRQGARQRMPKEAPTMRRRTFDAIMVAAGLALAAVLVVAGVLLTWGHTFVTSQVHNQLAAQKIYFPAVSNPEFRALPRADQAAMKP